MKLLVGTIPNLSWWRLKNMTEKEIEEFNRKHMVEIEMNDDSPNKTTQATLLEIERIVVWNAAIEQAAREAELWMDETVPTRIRNLNK